MPIQKEAYEQLMQALAVIPRPVTLVAVSKTKPIEDLTALYALGQKNFGENYVQELVSKQSQLPADIRWHFIGHLQTNKAKLIAPFVYCIHGVDSLKLLQEINKQAAHCHRVINCLLQVHIAKEDTKFGFDETALQHLIQSLPTLGLRNIAISGLMGMASFTDNQALVRREFKYLKSLFDQYTNDQNFLINNVSPLKILSMGMSADYSIALEEGSNMIRVGSLIFGGRV
jgi:PLP dependent protein